ncbi:VCBS repeat-containing protein [candidate division KSB1 bacterium]|nr:VCBS repeat-containing protein [candidate division KSB1 bacterium]
MKSMFSKTILSFMTVICWVSLCVAEITLTEHPITDSFIGAWAVDARDINGDGFIDIVGASNSDMICWWQNDGFQAFTMHLVAQNFVGVRSVQAADIDTDGDIDIVAAAWEVNDIAWWENDGNENFTQHVIDNNFIGAHTVEAKDVNQDGHVDILCSGFDYYGKQGEIAWWKNNGNQNFTKILISDRFQQSPFIHGEDIDGDGDIDILACGELNNEVVWWENDGNEQFTEHIIDDDFSAAHTVFARDFDLDGDMDILGAACLSSKLAWWENDGAQNFTKHAIYNLSGALWIDRIDLDNDADMDLIATGRTGVCWWENDGAQNLSRHAVNGAFSDGYCVISVDLDQDHDQDLIAAGRGCNRITWWENELCKFHFKAETKTGHAPLTTKFIDLSTSIDSIVSWQWDFQNDGVVDSEEKQPQWTYENPGSYSVRLDVATNFFSFTMVYENYIQVFNGESALRFHGSESKAICPAADVLNLTNAFTFEAMIHPDGWGEVSNLGFGRILDKKNISLYIVNECAAFNTNCLLLQLKHADGSGSITFTPENSIQLHTWQHVAATYDGSLNKANLYINGVLQPLTFMIEPLGTVADNGADNLIIGNDDTGSFAFDGGLDEVRIWNIARPAEAIQADMQRYLNGIEAGLIAYWKMNEGNGDTLTDGTPNENNATLSAVSWIEGAALDAPTSVSRGSVETGSPSDFRLYSNYPNPFNPTTRIAFYLPVSDNISIRIYNVSGEMIRTLVSQKMEQGYHSVIWDGTDHQQNLVSSGLYFYRMATTSFKQIRKMMLVK